MATAWVTSRSTATRRPGTPSTWVSATCAVNLSGASIGDGAFLDYIREQFASQPVPPQMICFEITETTAITNLADATRFISELQGLGCRFSLDDFCAGMSSFMYLKHLPVDYLKIDGSFVRDMLEDPIDRAMVEVINHIGHVMGKLTIAEFVESEEILQALREIGVDYAQGFAVGRPRPLAELLEELAACLPEGMRVTILADRGFGDQARYAQLRDLGMDFVIRFREGITLTDEFGKSGPASEWLTKTGRAKMWKDMAVTADCYVLPAVVLVHGSGGIYPEQISFWARLLNEQGIAAFVIDAFGPRGVSVGGTF